MLEVLATTSRGLAHLALHSCYTEPTGQEPLNPVGVDLIASCTISLPQRLSARPDPVIWFGVVPRMEAFDE